MAGMMESRKGTSIGCFYYPLYRTGVIGRVLDLKVVEGLVQSGTVPPLPSA